MAVMSVYVWCGLVGGFKCQQAASWALQSVNVSCLTCCWVLAEERAGLCGERPALARQGKFTPGLRLWGAWSELWGILVLWILCCLLHRTACYWSCLVNVFLHSLCKLVIKWRPVNANKDWYKVTLYLLLKLFLKLMTNPATHTKGSRNRIDNLYCEFRFFCIFLLCLKC